MIAGIPVNGPVRNPRVPQTRLAIASFFDVGRAAGDVHGACMEMDPLKMKAHGALARTCLNQRERIAAMPGRDRLSERSGA